MIRTVDPEAIGAVPYILPSDRQGPTAAASGCKSCAVYHPQPQLSGNLQIDPEMSLPSPGFGNNRIDIEYYYNAVSAANGAFGAGRSISALQTAQASGSSPLVTLTRGNGSQVSYLFNGTSYVAQTPGCLNSLSENGTYWQETDLDGTVSAFPYNTTGQITSLAYMEDAAGNIRTNLYSSGQLQNVQDPAGRLITFGYSGSLVEYIEDWAARRTTFLYDTSSASPLNLLTTVIGPTGCQTQYQHATFTSYSGGVYGSQWLLSGIVSPNGNGSSYLYDMQGRVTNLILAGIGGYTYLYQPGYMTTIDPAGGILTQALGNEFSLSAAQNQLGAITTFTRNANLQETSRQTPDGAIWSTAYTAGGLVASTETPLGEFTSFTHDAYGNIQTKQTPDSAIWTTLWGYAGSSFDTTGAKRRPQVTIDPLGNRVTMGYTAQGLPLFQQDMSGAIVTWGYNGYGDQVFKQDATNFLWTTTRDLAGNPIAQINPLGAIWSQTFDNMNRPLVSTDPLNNQTQRAYDSEGNQTVLITPLGYRTSTTFNAFDLPVSQQNALGYFFTNLYDALGRKIGAIDAMNLQSTLIWNAASQLVATQNPAGALWTNTLDGNGRVVAVQNPLGYSSSTLWDLDSRPYVQIDQLGNRTTAIFDVNSRQIAGQNPLGFFNSTVFDLASRPIAQVDALGNRSSTVWDGRNLATAQIDPLGRATSTTFNPNRTPIATMDPGGCLASVILDAAGNVVGNIDANNNLSSTAFDLANRPVARINALNQITTTGFDADSNVIFTQDPLNRVTTQVRDALDRVYATVTPLGYITTVNRDADGRTSSMQNAAGYYYSTLYNSASQPIASVSPIGYIQTTIRDAANQVVGSQNAMGYIFTNVLDPAGRQVASVSPMGYRTSATWDAASQRIATIDALGNAATTIFSANGHVIAEQNRLGYLTSFILDAASQRICVVDANNGRSTTLFTNRGYVSATQDQLGSLTSFTQDANGNDILRVDARNWPTTWTIDPLNRTSQAVFIDGTCWTNTWDVAGQRLTSQDSTGITSYVWDKDGRRIAVQNPTGINLTSTLDSLDNRLVLATPYGLTTNTFDIQSRLIGVMSPITQLSAGGPLYVSITRDPLDREIVRYNSFLGASVSHTFDPDGRETAVLNNAFFAPNFTNYYNGRGDRIGVSESSGGSVSFLYDPESQLTNEQRFGTDAFNTTYSWDPLGNRLVQNANGQITSRTFNAANEQLTLVPPSGPPTTSVWDANGNLTGETTGTAQTTLTWDPENRMASFASPTVAESYLYPQDGLRTEKTTNSGTTLFSWDEQNCHLETDTSLNLTARRTDNPGYWGGLSYQEIDGYLNIPLFDSQGTTRFAYWFIGSSFFASANILDAWGNLLSTPPSEPNPMVYVGQLGYYTDATGYIYLRGRLYDPVNGRFINRDPIGFAGSGPNEMEYVGNEPVGSYDPDGLVARKCVCITNNCPPGAITAPVGGGDGWTLCNTDNGQMYSFGCNAPWTLPGMLNAWHVCVDDCIAQHEAVHRADQGACCQAFAACLKNPKTKNLKKPSCADMWGAWTGPGTAGESWTECNAYKKGDACIQGAISRYCSKPDMGPIQTQLCDALKAFLAALMALEKKYCSKAPATQPPCPFNKDGTPAGPPK